MTVRTLLSTATLVTLSILAVLVAVRVGTANIVGQGSCSNTFCNQLPSIFSSSCPVFDGGFTLCKFDNSSKDPLVYCAVSKNDCNVLTPIVGQTCNNGYCAMNAAIGCSVTYNKCQ